MVCVCVCVCVWGGGGGGGGGGGVGGVNYHILYALREDSSKYGLSLVKRVIK